MATYFCFSDECGGYEAVMSEKQLRAHPFYIRSTLIINSSEWKALSNNFKDLKEKYGIPLSREFKWAFLWNIKRYFINKKTIPKDHELKIFEKYDYNILIEFVEEALNLINGLSEKKIIITYTNNRNRYYINEKSMLKMHLQEHMQRIEMELENDEEDNLGVLFFDPVSPEKNEYLRELYYELFENGDYLKYSHIKDSLNIENSHHSVGIQLADYISGAFSAIVKSNDGANYEDGVRMYFDSVHENLRRSWRAEVQGYGIREVPRNQTHRSWLFNRIEDFKEIHLER